MNKLLIALIILSGLFTACTSTTHINVVHPAAIAIPADLDSVVIIDRTQYVKGSKVGTAIESIFTGEAIGGDKLGVSKTLDLMKVEIKTGDRLKLMNESPIIIKNINRSFEYNTPIRGEFIDSIAKEYGADGIIALEYFDSDRAVNYRNSGSSTQSFVRSYWRLYYPNDQSIIDEFDMQTFGTGYNDFGTLVPAGYSSISRAGLEAADRYLKRIIPSTYRESRTYYTKGCTELKIAKGYIKNGVWDKAKFVLEEAFEANYSPKILGRISYNLAIVCEQLEQLDVALKYAYRAADTGNADAPKLVNILNTRVNEQPLIEEQMIRE